MKITGKVTSCDVTIHRDFIEITVNGWRANENRDGWVPIHYKAMITSAMDYEEMQEDLYKSIVCDLFKGDHCHYSSFNPDKKQKEGILIRIKKAE